MRARFRGWITLGLMTLMCTPGLPVWPQSQNAPPSGVPSVEELEKRLEEMERHRSKAGSRGGKADAVAMEILSGPMAQISGGILHMGDLSGDGRPDEKPTHDVKIRAFMLGRFEVTRAQFRRFANQTGFLTDAERGVGKSGCSALDTGTGKSSVRAGSSWRDPGFEQTDDHPVVCISWNDAQSYIRWLNAESGKHFRLASEAEWEYAARSGSIARYPWGMEGNLTCRYANGADQTPWPGLKIKWKTPLACNDRFFYTAPVGTYQPNDWGVSDLIGNVSEWIQDCYHTNYSGAPGDGSSWEGEPCGRRSVRGGSWRDSAEQLRVSRRWAGNPDDRTDYLGFRIAR